MSGADTTEPRRILGEDAVDRVADALLALTRELWVLTDRVMVLEHVLAGQGIDLAAIDRVEPAGELADRLDQRRSALVDTVTTALRGGESPGGRSDR